MALLTGPESLPFLSNRSAKASVKSWEKGSPNVPRPVGIEMHVTLNNTLLFIESFLRSWVQGFLMKAFLVFLHTTDVNVQKLVESALLN